MTGTLQQREGATVTLRGAVANVGNGIPPSGHIIRLLPLFCDFCLFYFYALALIGMTWRLTLKFSHMGPWQLTVAKCSYNHPEQLYNLWCPVQKENVDSLLKIIKKFKIVTAENYTKCRNLLSVKPCAIYIYIYSTIYALSNIRIELY